MVEMSILKRYSFFNRKKKFTYNGVGDTMKKLNFKTLLLLFTPLILGTLIGLITNSFNDYTDLIKPSFSPPGYIFPIVWSLLYLLMGISRYLIDKEVEDKETVQIYRRQLLVNLTWSIIFFILRFYFLAFIWILILIYLVFAMILKFYKINKVSAYLQIPYLLWILFAAFLNFSIYLLN